MPFAEARQLVRHASIFVGGRLPTSAARFDVCCILHCSRDCWVWTPIGCPEEQTIDNTLDSRVFDVPSIVGCLPVKSRLCCISSSCGSSGRCHANPGAKYQPAWLLFLQVLVVVVTWICKLESSKQRVCPSVAAQRGFRTAANFAMFQSRVWECSTQTTSTFFCVAPIAKTFLFIDHKVVRCQDTPRTCVQVIQPPVSDMCVTQVLNPRHLLPCSCGLQGIIQATQPSSVRQPGQLCLQLRRDQTSSSSRGTGDFFIVSSH